jgi:hypothetical protein
MHRPAASSGSRAHSPSRDSLSCRRLARPRRVDGLAPRRTVGRGTVPSHRSGMRDDLAGPVSGRALPPWSLLPKRSSEHRPERGTTGSRPRSPGGTTSGRARRGRNDPHPLPWRGDSGQPGPTTAQAMVSGAASRPGGHPVGRRWNGTLRGRVGSAHSLHPWSCARSREIRDGPTSESRPPFPRGGRSVARTGGAGRAPESVRCSGREGSSLSRSTCVYTRARRSLRTSVIRRPSSSPSGRRPVRRPSARRRMCG